MPDVDDKDEKKEEQKTPPQPASEAKLKRLGSLYKDIKGYHKSDDPEDIKIGTDLATRIGKTQAEAGLAELDKLITKLNDEAIKKMANTESGGLKKELKRPDDQKEQEAGNQAIAQFKDAMDDIAAKATDIVAEIKTKLETEIKKFESGTPPSDAQWKKAFESDLQATFNEAIDAQIETLKGKKLTEIEDKNPAGPIKRDLTAIYDAQIKSLEDLKTQFNAEIDDHKNQTILDAIINAKHPKDASPNVAALAEPSASPAEDIERKILEEKKKEESKNEATIEDYALFARFQRRELELGKVRERRIAWNTEETEHFLKALKNQKENYVLWGEMSNQFKFTDEGIHFTAKWRLFDADAKKDITAILDVFYAKTGRENAVLTADKGVSYDYLMKIADVVQERQKEPLDIDKKPTITLNPKTAEQLIETLKKQGNRPEEAQEKVRILAAKLSGEQAVDGVYKTPLPSSEKPKPTATARPAPGV